MILIETMKQKINNYIKHKYLQVLSSEMDVANSEIIGKVLIKRRVTEIFREFRPPPSCESYLIQ